MVYLLALEFRYTKGSLAGNPLPDFILIPGITTVLGSWLLSPSPNPIDSKQVK